MGLTRCRAEIDLLDEQIVRALARRFAVCRDVAELKARSGIPMMQPQRVSLVKRRAIELARQYGLPVEVVDQLYDQMVTAICAMEDEIIERCTAEAAAPPLFVGGDDRSGTTLVSVILDSHPDLVVGPELDYLLPEDLGPHLRECCRLLLADDPRVRGAGVQTADSAYGMGVQLARQARRFGIDHATLDALAAAAMQRTGSDLVTHDQRLALLDAMGRHRCRTTGKRRWGIKIQRQIADAAALVEHWPGSRFVHVVRDGRDVAASQLRGARGWGYRSVHEAAAGWREVVEAVRGAVPPASLHELRYEDLVADPETVLRRLLDFLEVDWDPAVLRHTDAEHSLFAEPFEHPSAEAVRRPIQAGSVGRHRRDLTMADRMAFEAVAGDALRHFGYLPASAGRGPS